MSLDTVVEDIRDEARARANEIKSEGEERADEIISEAKRDAEEIRQQAERDAERRIEQEREQRISGAKLEAKQERLDARREVIEEVREDVEARIAAIDGDERAELTRTLLDVAAKEFSDANVVHVHGRADDEELLEAILEDYDGFDLGESIECLGGVAVEAEESRVRVSNTFDSILEEIWDDNLREISARLFEE
jgi:V/A-type H+-transporting ATPase subunit E